MMEKIRAFVNGINFEDYEGKADVIDSVTCELIETAADYNKIAELVTIALDEREARETA